MGKKYYKVVEVKYYHDEIEKYYSAIAFDQWRVEYFIDRWVGAPEWLRRKGYNLLVFDNLGAAIAMVEDVACFKLFQVKARGIETELPPFRTMISGTIIGDGKGWPVGTVMVEKVKLTKQVYPKNETKDE
ncbi:MAG: hypothetical protein WDA47_03140 [Bacilli bacterium]